MTKYEDLTLEDITQLDKDLDTDLNPGYKKEKVLTQIKSGFYCAKCWRSHYTCLCSHDD